MGNKDILQTFFDAENVRDWELCRSLLSPEVVWTLYGTETEVVTVRGIDAYISAMDDSYAIHDYENTFVTESMDVNLDGSRIVTFLRNNHGVRYCDVFDFKDGLIVGDYEFVLG